MSDLNQIDEFYTSSSSNKNDSSNKRKTERPGFWQRFKNSLPSRYQLRLLPQVLSKKERYLILIFLSAGLLSLLYIPLGFFYHITQPVPDFGGSYSEGLLGTPQYINPLLIQANDADRDISEIVYSSLMKYDQSGNIVPDMAESYEISDNQLEYTFVLKKDIKWHDGLPLNADDVIFTLGILQNNDYGSIQRINWQGVEIEKINDYTVKLKLKNKYAQFLNNTTLGILPKHLWENVKPNLFSFSELNLKPIGSGPYKFKKLKKDSNGSTTSYELTAYENYHGQKPFIKNLTFKFFNSEDELVQAYNSNVIEGIGFLSTEKIKNLKFSQKLSPQKIRLPRYFAAFFNQNQSKVLTDKNIRLALNYATDKQELLDKVLDQNGLVINSPILKELTQQETAQKYAYDKEFAKQILENSGWKDSDGDGFREKEPAKKNQTEPKNEAVIEIKTSHSSDLSKAAEILKKQWEEVGFKVSIKVETLTEIQQSIRDRDYEVLLFGEVLGLDFDPYSFWHSSQKKDPGLNLALYDNKTADKILEEGRQIFNTSERIKKYEDFEKILLEDAPAIFLYSPYYLYMPSKKIKGNQTEILSIPSARFDNISQWYTNTKRVSREK
ncbi:MAG TPA: ABC transporter substrate-binding protein [Candidatus Paceibacterota bacterium]